MSAKQIINLTDGNKIVANEDTLREILLQPSIKDKKVCVVSIAGTFRQGKSFFLNFLIHYLEQKYKFKKTLNQRWLNVEDGNIAGFPWKSGSDRHTTGILMWSEIYLAEMPDGEEVAVILMDTQGTFDNKTTKQHCAALFAIGTLISSVLIFNLKEKVTQYDLEHLECFSGYGQLASADNAEYSGTPFQKLCFLIRDWPYKHEYDYGIGGGSQFLKNVTDSPEIVPQELRAQKENIIGLFEEISCCLLPYPGEKVASDPYFNGSFEDIDPRFIKYVEEFVPSILAPENLLPKIINGESITSSSLFTFIRLYSQYFSSGKVPPLTTMYKAAAEAQLKITLNEAENIYRDAMDPVVNSKNALKTNILEENHFEYKQSSIDYFNNKKILGNDEMKSKYKEFLKEHLEQRYLEYKRLNRVKLEKEEELARREKEFEEIKKTADAETKKRLEYEIKLKMESFRQQQAEMERQLWEERSKFKEEKFQLEVANLRQRQAFQEELQKKDKELRKEKHRRYKDRMNAQRALFAEKQKRWNVEMEVEMNAKLHNVKGLDQKFRENKHLNNNKFIRDLEFSDQRKRRQQLLDAEASYKIASEECERLYQSLMVGLLNMKEALPSGDFEVIHAEAKKQTMENFDTRKMLGGRDMKLKYRGMLNQALDQKFREYKQLNDSKLNRDLELSNQRDKHQQLLDQQTRQLTIKYAQEFDRKKTEIEKMIENRKEEIRKHDQNKARKRESAIPAHLRSRITAVPVNSAPTKRKSKYDLWMLRRMCTSLMELLLGSTPTNTASSGMICPSTSHQST